MFDKSMFFLSFSESAAEGVLLVLSNSEDSFSFELDGLIFVLRFFFFQIFFGLIGGCLSLVERASDTFFKIDSFMISDKSIEN